MDFSFLKDSQYLELDDDYKRDVFNRMVSGQAEIENVEFAGLNDDVRGSVLDYYWDNRPQVEEPEKGFFSNMFDLGLSGAKKLKTGMPLAVDVARGEFSEDAPEAIHSLLTEPEPQPEELKRAANNLSTLGADWEEAQGFMESVGVVGRGMLKIAKEAITNPKGLAYMTAEQAANMVPSIAGMLAGGKLGLLGGPAAPVTVPAGAFLGSAAGGAAVEMAIETAGFVDDALKERGLDPTEENIRNLLADPEAAQQIISQSRKKGIGTAATDAILTLVGGKIAISGGKSISRIGRAGRIAGGAAVDIAGEGLSEAAGQKWAKGEVDMGDVALETFAGVGGAASELAGAAKALSMGERKADDDPDAQPSVATPELVQARLGEIEAGLYSGDIDLETLGKLDLSRLGLKQDDVDRVVSQYQESLKKEDQTKGLAGIGKAGTVDEAIAAAARATGIIASELTPESSIAAQRLRGYLAGQEEDSARIELGELRERWPGVPDDMLREIDNAYSEAFANDMLFRASGEERSGPGMEAFREKYGAYAGGQSPAEQSAQVFIHGDIREEDRARTLAELEPDINKFMGRDGKRLGGPGEVVESGERVAPGEILIPGEMSMEQLVTQAKERLKGVDSREAVALVKPILDQAEKHQASQEIVEKSKQAARDFPELQNILGDIIKSGRDTATRGTLERNLAKAEELLAADPGSKTKQALVDHRRKKLERYGQKPVMDDADMGIELPEIETGVAPGSVAGVLAKPDATIDEVKAEKVKLKSQVVEGVKSGRFEVGGAVRFGTVDEIRATIEQGSLPVSEEHDAIHATPIMSQADDMFAAYGAYDRHNMAIVFPKKYVQAKSDAATKEVLISNENMNLNDLTFLIDGHERSYTYQELKDEFARAELTPKKADSSNKSDTPKPTPEQQAEARAQEINGRVPGHDVKFDGLQEVPNKAPYFQFTPQSGPAKGATFVVKDLESIEEALNRKIEQFSRVDSDEDAESETPSDEASESKEPWKMTIEEYVRQATGGMNDPDVISVAKFSHAKHVKQAIVTSEDVPLNVLEGYKNNVWAQKAIEAKKNAEIVTYIDSAINGRERSNRFINEGKKAFPEIRAQEAEEAGRWAYAVAKGEATQEEFDAWKDQMFKEGRAAAPRDKGVYDVFWRRTDMPLYDDMIKNKEYHEQKKGRTARIELMSPDEYLKMQAEAKGVSLEEDLKIVNRDSVEKIKKMMQSGEKVYMLSIEADKGYQEGRHRAIAAKELELKTVPVLIVEPFKKAEAKPAPEESASDILDRLASEYEQHGIIGQLRDRLGDKLSPGKPVKTNTGRQTTPFPALKLGPRSTQNTLKEIDQWLIQNAFDEAVSRGDDFNKIQFEQDLGRKNIPRGSKDSAEDYLFGDHIPPVPKSPLKDLVTPSKPVPIGKNSRDENVYEDEEGRYTLSPSGWKTYEPTKEEGIGYERKPGSPWITRAEASRYGLPTMDDIRKSEAPEPDLSTEWDKELTPAGRLKTAKAMGWGDKTASRISKTTWRNLSPAAQKILSKNRDKWADDTVKTAKPGIEDELASMDMDDIEAMFDEVVAEKEGQHKTKPETKEKVPDGWESLPGTGGSIHSAAFGNYTISGAPGQYRLVDGDRGLQIGGAFTDLETAVQAANQHWIDRDKKRTAYDPIERPIEAPKTLTPADILKNAAGQGVKGLDEVTKGLYELFGGKSLKSFPGGIDEDTYAKARPHFEAGFKSFVEAGKSLKEFMHWVVDSFGKAVKPYMMRWIGDKKSAGLTTEEEGPTIEEKEGEDGQIRADNEDLPEGQIPGEVSANEEGELPEPVLPGPGGSGIRAEGETDSVRDDGSRGQRSGTKRNADYVITNADGLGKGGPKQKFRDNLAAIQVLKDLGDRQATPQEQAILVKYVGWGGLPQAFPYPDGSIAKGWEAEVDELRNALSDEEYAAARRSTQDAHYTSQTIVKGVYAALKRFGFKRGKILEPSVGTGNFIGLMPKGVRSKSKITGIELDPTTSAIAKQLYPEQDIVNSGFENIYIAPGSFDLAVGNPPFGDKKLFDADNQDLRKFSIHNFFFAKSLKGLRENGILAMVVSSSMMDKIESAQRIWINERAELIGAIRLPNNAFKENARTEVTTDIVFLRKRAEGERVEGEPLPGHAWGGLKTVRGKDNDWRINEYFAENPEMMLGELAHNKLYPSEIVGGLYNGVPGMVAKPGVSLDQAIAEAVDRLPADIYKSGQTFEEVQNPDIIVSDPGYAQPYGYTLDDSGRAVRRLPDRNGVQRYELVKYGDENLSGSRLERFKGLLQLRDDVRRLIRAEVSDDTKMESYRKTLNRHYDAFVETFGYISSSVNTSTLKNDPSDLPLLRSLEKHYDAGVSESVAKRTGQGARGPSAEKASVFKVRMRQPYKDATHADNAKDGLAITLRERGTVDLDHIVKLTGKTEADITKELEGLIFLDPETDTWETAASYLSGNVKKKLAAAKRARSGDDKYKPNVEALEKAIPKDVPPDLIHFRVGASWFPSSFYEDFASEKLNSDYEAHHIDSLGVWVAGIRRAGQSEYGTASASAAYIFDRMVQGKDVVVRERDADGKLHIDREATTQAQAKAAEIDVAFQDWVLSDGNRRNILAQNFNEKINTHVKPTHDGSHMIFPGMGVINAGVERDKQLRPHQKNAVWRLIQKGKGLLDHVVGSGKTFAAISTGLELKRMGLIKKPMYVVPNHLVPQWSDDFQKLYPGANVLAISKTDFAKKNRQEFLARIATGDWDAVLIAHSSFGFISMPGEFEMKFYKEQLEQYEAAITAMRAENGSKRTVKQMEDARDRLRERMKALANRPIDHVVDFSELGVDSIFIDEAHEFKNLFYATSRNNIAGLSNSSGSKKAFDLFVKTQFIFEMNNGRGVFFLTGTPISNSIAEMYTMMRYMDYGRLKDMGASHFDQWASIYASAVTDWEVDPTGTRYRLQTKMDFVNVPGMVSFYNDFADTVTTADLRRIAAEAGEIWPIPDIRGGKPNLVIAERSELQKSYSDYVVYRFDHMPQDAKIDNPLTATGDAMKAALDIRLINEALPDFAGSKVNLCVNNIVDTYQKWSSKKGTQLVFCDLSVPKKHRGKHVQEIKDLKENIKRLEQRLLDERNDEKITEIEEEYTKLVEKLERFSPAELMAASSRSTFSVYDDVKAKLIQKGIPEDQIAFIHDANTDKQKADLFKKVQSGKVRVLIGSTSKMGAGMNVQDRLVALHHLDAPWRPSDLEQREGRIIRQGNIFFDEALRRGEKFEVDIFRYATKETLDTRRWQVIERKAKSIEQFRKGGAQWGDKLEDSIGEASNAAEMKAASSGNPLILEEIQLRKELDKLESLKRGDRAKRFQYEADIKNYETRRDTYQGILDDIKADVDLILKNPKDNTPQGWKIVLDGQDFRAERLMDVPEPTTSQDKDEIKANKAAIKKAEEHNQEAFRKAKEKFEQVASSKIKAMKGASSKKKGPIFHYRGVTFDSYTTGFLNQLMIEAVLKSADERFGGVDTYTVLDASEDVSGAGLVVRFNNILDKFAGSQEHLMFRQKAILADYKEKHDLAKDLLAKHQPQDFDAELSEKRSRHNQVVTELQTSEAKQSEDYDFSMWGGPSSSGGIITMADVVAASNQETQENTPKYYTHIDGEFVAQDSAEPIDIIPWAETFVYKNDNDHWKWKVVERSSGLTLGGGKTRMAAIEDATAKAERAGEQRLKELIEQATSKSGKAPQYSVKMAPRYSVKMAPGKALELEDIQAIFKGYPSGVSANDNSVWVQLPSGTLRIKTVQQIAYDSASFEAEYKRKLKPGEVIFGKYLDWHVEIKAGLGDRYTLFHELEHFAEDIGLLTNGEIFAVNRALRESGQAATAENRAIWIEENLYSRAVDRKTRLGKILQKVKDFIDSLVNLFTQTTGGALRAIESGKVFGREGKTESTQTVPMFALAGPRAKGVDTGLLAKAKSMKDEGKSREQVWKDTGWWEIVPGQWSFEIDDSGISIDLGYKSPMGFPYSMSDYLVGAESILEAYPEIDEYPIFVDIDPHNGGRNSGSFTDIGTERGFKVETDSADKAKAIFLHEIQHAIQHSEGFARGGNLSVAKTLPEYQKALMEAERIEKETGAWTAPEWDIYKRLTGEAESRLVQKRLDMTADQKKAEPPWVTLEKMLKEEGLLEEGQNPEDILISRYDEGVDSFYVDEGYKPKKTVKAYKLFEIKRKAPGKLFPLFIGRMKETPIGKWVIAEFLPTKGFAKRPGWHAGHLPIAPHLRQRSTGAKNPNRVWVEIEMPADVEWQTTADQSKTKDIRDRIPEDGHYRFKTSKMQGGAWMIGGAVKINKIMSDEDVAAVLREAGYPDEEIRKEQSRPSKLPQYSVRRVVNSDNPAVDAKADALLKKLLGVFPKGMTDAKKAVRAIDRYKDLTETLKDDKKDIYEKQKALENHVKAELPMEDRGRALHVIKFISRPVTAAGRQKMLERAINRVNQIHENVQKARDIRAIHKLLKPSKRGQKKGVAAHEGLSLEAQEVIKEIRAVVEMPEADAASEIESLIESLDKDYAESLSDKEGGTDETETARRLAVLQTFSGLEAKTGADVALSKDILTELLKTGRLALNEKIKAERAERKQFREMALEIITGGKGVKPGRIERLETAAEKQSLWGRIKEKLRSFDDMHQSYEFLLDKLSRFDAGSETLRGELVDRYARMAFEATEQEQAGVQAHQNLLASRLAEIWGVSGVKLGRRLHKNSTLQEKTGVTQLTENGKRAEIPLSQNQAYKLFQMFQQPSIQEEMKAHGYDAQTLSELEKFLDPKVREWAEWQVKEFFPNYRTGVNEVFQDLFYTKMPEIENYSPISRVYYGQTEDEALLKGSGFFASAVPGAVRSRIKNARDFNILDGDTVLLKHIVELEHFKAWGKPMREIRSVLGCEPVQRAVKQYHGRTANQVLQGFHNDFASGGRNSSQSLHLLDALRANFTRAVIGANPVVFMKQLASIPAYAMDIPTVDFLKGFAYALRHPLKIHKTLMESKTMQARYKVGFERDIILAMRRDVPKTVTGQTNVSDFLMLSTKLGDKLAIMAGGWSVYDYHLKRLTAQGMGREAAHQEALHQFARATRRSQQAGDTMDLGYVQRSWGSIGKLFTMFMTSPTSYYRNTSAALRNLVARRKGANVKRLVVSWVILNMTFQLIADGFDWEPEKQAKAVLLGPLNGLFIVRDLVGTMSAALFEGVTYWTAGAPPPLTTANIGAQAMRRANKMMEEDFDDEEFPKMLMELAEFAGNLAGAPVGPVKRILSGVSDAVTGDTEHPIRRSMGYTENTLGED